MYILQINQLSKKLYGKMALQYHSVPSEYTNELFGLEYLHQQSSCDQLALINDECTEDGEGDDDDEIDEGFGEETLLFSLSVTTSEEDPITVALPSEEEDEMDDQQEVSTIADVCNSYIYEILMTGEM